MKHKLTILLVLTSLTLSGQDLDSISLEDCYGMAERAYPLLANRKLVLQEGEVNAARLKTAYLPSLYFQAEAKYLSEVINLNQALPIPGFDIPSPPNDQYNLSIVLKQLIYDGGITKKRKEIELQKSLIEEQSIKIEMYKLKERINTIFFSILLLQNNRLIYGITEQNLNESLKMAESAVRNGTLLQSDLDLLEVEIAGLQQTMLENEFNISKGIKVLAMLVDTNFTDNIILQLPEVILDYEARPERPEISLFEMQKRNLDLSTNLLSSSRRPVLSGFGQFGYGQPGLNPMNDSFDSYYILGIKLSWNIYDWNKTGKEKEVLEINRQKISNQRASFEYNLNMELRQEREDIKKYSALIEKDKEIIELRERIVASSVSRLNNGVINSADYIRDLGSSMAARIKLNIHDLLLVKSKIYYITIQGKDLYNN